MVFLIPAPVLVRFIVVTLCHPRALETAIVIKHLGIPQAKSIVDFHQIFGILLQEKDLELITEISRNN